MEPRCRLCAEVTVNPNEILDLDLRFTSILGQIFNLEITADDRLPKTVCEECYLSVEKSWQLKEAIDKAQVVLNGMIHT